MDFYLFLAALRMLYVFSPYRKIIIVPTGGRLHS